MADLESRSSDVAPRHVGCSRHTSCMATNKHRVRELQERHRRSNFDRMMAYLAEHPCVDCGEQDPVVLDFDHLPGTLKRWDIGRAVSGSTRSWAAIEEEIAKCEIVCANCHRRRTASRAGQRKHVLASGGTLVPVSIAPKAVVEHGGGAKGRYACKCELCMARRAAYSREWRARAKADANANATEAPGGV